MQISLKLRILLCIPKSVLEFSQKIDKAVLLERGVKWSCVWTGFKRPEPREILRCICHTSLVHPWPFLSMFKCCILLIFFCHISLSCMIFTSSYSTSLGLRKLIHTESILPASYPNILSCLALLQNKYIQLMTYLQCEVMASFPNSCSSRRYTEG